MADIQTQLPVKLTDGTNTVAITGTAALKIDLSATASNTNAVLITGGVTTTPTGTQTVQVAAGTVIVGNTITVTTPATQTVQVAGGTIIVGNSVTIVASSGTQTVAPGPGTFTVSFGETTTGVVVNYNTQASVAAGSTGTISYTVSASKTLWLKGVLAAASGGPCKVVVDWGSATLANLAVGFFSTASPYISVPFFQPFGIPTGAEGIVSVKITNNAHLAQDVYATIMGHEL